MKKSPRLRIDEGIVSAIREEAHRLLENAKGSHGWDHTERVHRLALKIGKKEGADLKIVELAALLHDIGREKEDASGGKICHGRAGAGLARAILEKYGIDRKTVGRVVHCIRAHRFRGGLAPKTIEARVLFDADKLDSIGAVGIGRAFLFAGEIGARLHDKNIDVRKTKAYSRDDTAYREYLVKLSKVKNRMFTLEGKRLARERHRFMTDFFRRLNRETEGQL